MAACTAVNIEGSFAEYIMIALITVNFHLHHSSIIKE